MFGHHFFGAAYFGPHYFGPAGASAVAFDGGGIPLTRGQLKRHKRKAEEDRRRREAGWEAGLLASRELIEQIGRAFDGPPVVTITAMPESFTDEDDEEAILMLVMS